MIVLMKRWCLLKISWVFSQLSGVEHKTSLQEMFNQHFKSEALIVFFPLAYLSSPVKGFREEVHDQQ